MFSTSELLLGGAFQGLNFRLGLNMVVFILSLLTGIVNSAYAVEKLENVEKLEKLEKVKKLESVEKVKKTDPLIFVVGEFDKHVLSSRDVLIYEKIERAIYTPNLTAPVSLKGEDFKKLVTATLLEFMIEREAQDIQAAGVSPSEIEKALSQVKNFVAKDQQWLAMDVHNTEMRQGVQRKLVAKKFIKFKAGASTVKVSDQDALAYYESNKERFGQLPFSHFKSNIRAFLTRKQLDERLRDWFEVLQTKYSAKNLANEF